MTYAFMYASIHNLSVLDLSRTQQFADSWYYTPSYFLSNHNF